MGSALASLGSAGDFKSSQSRVVLPFEIGDPLHPADGRKMSGLMVGGHMSEAVCAVCGKAIGENESRFVDVHAGTKIHVHTECKRK